MTDLDPAAVEERFRALESELGAFDLGTAIRVLLKLDEQWLNVVSAEIRRCATLYIDHYREHEGQPTVSIGRRPLAIRTSHDELIAAIGFLQGVTFAEALRQERER
jgi:hypothetical protein